MRIKGVLLLNCVLLLINYTIAQNNDDGQMMPYSNEYYQEIQKGINDYENRETKPYMVFKMDVSEKDIPKSIDDFNTVWCHDPVTQGRTGTCWCFSTSSFYESEIYRQTKQEVKLSELYTVYWEYVEKSREYIRTRGNSFFGEGSEANAVARMMKKYGVVPAEAYTGMKNGQKFHDHQAMYDEMKGYLESLKRDNSWNEATALTTIKSILHHYIGVPPAELNWKGKKVTPMQFMQEVKLQPDEYVNFMSLKMSPYYEKALYDVPDNWWRSDDYYNVPLDDFINTLKTSLKEGYSISLGGDVSESGYIPESDVAMVPSYDIPSEYIDENARQLRFSNGSTTDDHAIHLMGYKEGKDGKWWFLIKDSGSGARNGKFPGYYFYHEDYVKLKMMSFTVHKDAAKDVLKKMKVSDL